MISEQSLMGLRHIYWNENASATGWAAQRRGAENAEVRKEGFGYSRGSCSCAFVALQQSFGICGAKCAPRTQWLVEQARAIQKRNG